MLRLKPTSTASPNGQSFRTYDMDGLIRGTAPIAELIPLSIYDINAWKVKRFSFKDEVDFSLLVKSFRADIKGDDELVFEDDGRPKITYVSAYVNVLDKERVVENVNFFFNSYPSTGNHLILDHTKEFEIKTDKDINRLTFFCQPIHLLPGIDIIVPDNNPD